MFSPVRGCVETSESVYTDTPVLRSEKQPKVCNLFLNPTLYRTSMSVHLLVILLHLCKFMTNASKRSKE